MKKILFTIILVVTTATACVSDTDDDLVYICTGSSAERYHKIQNCSGLSSCKKSVTATTINRAKSQGRTPCKKCY